MPLAPANVAAVIPYLIYSSGLAADLKQVAGRSTTRAKIRVLNSVEKRYGFGSFRNGNIKYYGVERHYDEVGAVRLIKLRSYLF